MGLTTKKNHAVMRRLDEPIFIAGPARSGTSLLFSILSKAPSLWSPYRELHGLYEWDIGLHPDLEAGESNRLTAEAATVSRRSKVKHGLWKASYNTELIGEPLQTGSLPFHAVRLASKAWKWGTASIRIVDKNPKHCFRVHFLKEIFPDARFVFLYRRPEANISSLIEGWKSGRYATYEVPVPGGTFQWHFDLPPGWREWIGMDLPERCAHQWVGYNKALLDAESELPGEDVVRCHYEALTERPLEVARRLFAALDLEMSDTVQRHCNTLPVVNSVSDPDPEKWRKREEVIQALEPIYRPTAESVGYHAMEAKGAPE